MKAPASYMAWLQRRIEEGNDLDRCRRQIEAWKAKPPEGLAVRDLDGLLATLDGAAKPQKAKPRPAADIDAFG